MYRGDPVHQPPCPAKPDSPPLITSSIDTQMSTSAVVVVLFKDKPEEVTIHEIARLAGISGLEELEEPDHYVWVSPAGELEYLSERRNSPLIGEVPMEGRLFQTDLGRYNYPTGPSAHRHAVSALLGSSYVQYVWYGPNLTGMDGCSDIKPMTPERVLAFFD